MAVSLTPGAISKIWTGKCTCASKDLKPMLQLTYIDCPQTLTEDDNQWRDVVLSDGSFSQFGYIAEEIFISNKLQEGSIVQLTKFRLTEQIYEGEFYSAIFVTDVHVILTKCDIIGDPKAYPHNKTSLIEKSTPLVDTGHSNQKEDHAAKDIPRIASIMMGKNKEDDMCACFEKLENIGWGTEDPLYDTALLLFCESADYRKLWLLLKPESCRKWVKNAGNWVGDKGDRRSTSGYLTLVGGNLVTWRSKKQKLLTEIGYPPQEPSKVMSDNKAAIQISENPVQHDRTKHIEIDRHFIKEKLEAEEGSIVQLTKFWLTEQIYEGEFYSAIFVTDVHVILTKCDIIGDPKAYPHNKTSLIEKSTPLVDTGHSNQKEDHAAKDIPRIASMMMGKNKEDDMCACFKKLENIGWGTEDPLYDTALLLFGESADYRKLWLLLKPESCRKWVKNDGKVEPLCYVLGKNNSTTVASKTLLCVWATKNLHIDLSFFS
ncbi:putative ribonuclease H-like domain-containing protein [Tanacetum coccineum]